MFQRLRFTEVCSCLLLSVFFIYVAKPLPTFLFWLNLFAYCHGCELLQQIPIFIAQLWYSNYSVFVWEKACFCQCSVTFPWSMVIQKQIWKCYVSEKYSKIAEDPFGIPWIFLWNCLFRNLKSYSGRIQLSFCHIFEQIEQGLCCVLGAMLRDFLGYFLLEKALGSMKTKGLTTLTEASPTKS